MAGSTRIRAGIVGIDAAGADVIIYGDIGKSCLLQEQENGKGEKKYSHGDLLGTVNGNKTRPPVQ